MSDISINENYVVLTNGRQIIAYEIIWKLRSNEKFELNPNLSQNNEKISRISTNLIGTFSKDNEVIIVFERNIITLFPSGVTIYSMNGTVIASIPVLQVEGEPIGMSLCGNYLTIFTIEGYLKVYDVSDRDPKLITSKSMVNFC